MPLTVADVVALPLIQSAAPVILSDRGFDRVVRWVHVSDLADLSQLVRGGELVLTRGGALRRSARRYLERLESAHVVGAVVEVDPKAPPLPPSVGLIAEQLGLALVAVHRQIKFVEVTEEVHRAIVAEQFEEVDFARRLHVTFTELSVHRATPSEIVDAAARLVERPVVLEDLAHQALFFSTAGRPAPRLLNDWDQRSRVEASGRSADGVDAPWAVTTVGRSPDQWGRLIAVGIHIDSARVRMVLERAAQALVLYRMAERGRSDIEHQASSGLIEDVRRNRIHAENDVAARAFALGLRPSRSYVPAVARAREWGSEGDPVADQRRNARLLDTVVRTTRAMGHTGLFSMRGPGEIGVVLAAQGPRGSTEVHALELLGAALRRDVRREVGSADLVVGRGSAVADLIGAIHRLEEAAHIAEAATSLPVGDRTVFTNSDIRLRGLLTLLRDDTRVQRFAESELRALLLHDIETGDNCLEVLRGYLDLAHHKTALARHLHLSRPALYAKLRYIEELLDVELSDGESATSLHVALLALEARNRSATRSLRRGSS